MRCYTPQPSLLMRARQALGAGGRTHPTRAVQVTQVTRRAVQARNRAADPPVQVRAATTTTVAALASTTCQQAVAALAVMLAEAAAALDSVSASPALVHLRRRQLQHPLLLPLPRIALLLQLLLLLRFLRLLLLRLAFPRRRLSIEEQRSDGLQSQSIRQAACPRLRRCAVRPPTTNLAAPALLLRTPMSAAHLPLAIAIAVT